MRVHTAKVWGDHRFYKFARTSIRPGVVRRSDEERSAVATYVPVPNPKATLKPSPRPGRWRAGPDGVRVPTGPKRVPARLWVPKT